MEEKTTGKVTEEDQRALNQHRLLHAFAAMQSQEDRKAPKKIRSKKKRRALAKKAHKSRVRNG